MPITDSYDLFIEFFSKNTFSEDAFINWGLDHIFFAGKAEAEKAWDNIKQNWRNNENLWIRNSGRNGQSSRLYTDFYAQFGKVIYFDATNNNKPTAAILSALGKVKYRDSHSENSPADVVRNYQVSHIWGHTKNPLLFVCPWNICLVPKLFDPFTGHEAKGPLIQKFQKAFIDKAKGIYTDLICDYNYFVEKEIIQTGLINDYIDALQKTYGQTDATVNKFIKNIQAEITTIDI